MATATNTTLGEIVLGGDLTGAADSPQLISTGVIPGTYAPLGRIVVDAKGRALAAGQVTPAELIAAVPDATTLVRGIVQVGNNINVSSAIISVPNASSSVKGAFSPQSPMVEVLDEVQVDYNALNAAGSTKGFVAIGSGLSVTAGVVSIGDATAVDLGIAQIGSGLSVTSGVVSVKEATAANLGIVQIGSGLAVASGIVSLNVADATTSSTGLVQIDSSLSVASGVASILDATNSDLGKIIPANTSNLTLGSAGELDIGTNVPRADQSNTYSGSQVSSKVSEAFSYGYAPDFSKSNCFEMTLTGVVTLLDPTNVVAGGIYTIIFKQDSTGSRLLNIVGSSYKYSSVGLSAAPNAMDVITLICKSSTEIYVLITPGF